MQTLTSTANPNNNNKINTDSASDNSSRGRRSVGRAVQQNKKLKVATTTSSNNRSPKRWNLTIINWCMQNFQGIPEFLLKWVDSADPLNPVEKTVGSA